jgi:adenosine deaminase
MNGIYPISTHSVPDEEDRTGKTDMSQRPEKNWFESVPKVELHLHLEGAIPHDALWELIRKYGGDPRTPDLDALRRRFEYRDFEHFIETWTWKNRFLREYDDFTLIAESVARDLADQNIRYAEAFFSPADFYRHGLRTQRLAEALRAGLSCVTGVEISLIADLVRDFGAESAAVTLDEVNEVRSMGVIGIGIGGSERPFPPEWFKDVYRKAREMGFHTNAHAGEASGPESVWGAVRDLQAERIGHGTRAWEDPALVEYLFENKIPIEVCPMSNVKTGVVPSIDAHPVRRFFEKGLILSINTDDPKMFGNSLADEFSLLETRLGFSREEIRVLILQGIRSSWMPNERKQRMIGEFTADPNWMK